MCVASENIQQIGNRVARLEAGIRLWLEICGQAPEDLDSLDIGHPDVARDYIRSSRAAALREVRCELIKLLILMRAKRTATRRAAEARVAEGSLPSRAVGQSSVITTAGDMKDATLWAMRLFGKFDK
jgi:hypothetical protein